MDRKKKRFVVAGAVGALVVGGGAAYAYWTDTGSGSSTATTGTSASYGVAVTAASGNAALSPGGPVASYTFVVTNNGTGNQKVTAADVKVENADGTAWTAVSGCSAADYAITNVSVTSADLAAGGTTPGSFKVQMVNGSGNQDACKNASVPLHVTVS